MITKIMKHDFLALRKPLGITIALALSTALLAALVMVISRNVIGITLVVLAFLALIAAFLVYSIILLVHYYRSMYGKTGYFTMSIPARPTELFWAKSLFNVLALCLFTLVFFCGGFVLLISALLADTTGTALHEAFTRIETWQLAFVVLTALLFSAISGVFTYQFIVTTGNRRPFLDRFGTVGGPILVAVLLYVGVQVISFILILPPGQLVLFAPDTPFISLSWTGGFINDVFSPRTSSTADPIAFPIWVLIGNAILTVVMGYLTAVFLSKNTSLR